MITILHVICLAVVKTITDFSIEAIYGKLGIAGFVIFRVWDSDTMEKKAAIYLSLILVVLSISLKAIQIYKELKYPKKDENRG